MRARLIFWYLLTLIILPHQIGYSERASETEWIGDLVFQNECNGNESSLIEWNIGEDFPSLGIGHFIWYPELKPGPFDESFPKLLAFIESKGIGKPSHLKLLSSKHAPWKSRDEFIQTANDSDTAALRSFLVQTKTYQAEFLIDRFIQAIPKILGVAPKDTRQEIQGKLTLLIESEGGLYPLIDYVNFNGEGLLQSERYHNQGWGLLQVLEEMDITNAKTDAVGEFVRSAEKILERRVANSPPERNEKRWLPGWKSRTHTYLTERNHSEILADQALRVLLLASV